MKFKKILKTTVAVATTALVATSAHASGLGDIAAGIDLSDGKAGVIAIGVAVGGFLVVGIAVRSILGMMKRL